jgi:pimeloyl-ACP methyl ester carboxylesterase
LISSALTLLACVACSTDKSGATTSKTTVDAGNVTSHEGDGGPQDSGTTAACDHSKRPILFVNGIMGGGDNFELQAMRFMSNGYCKEAIRAYDYDATYLAFGGAPQSATDDNVARLDAFVDAYLKDSGFDTIDLVGHSYGTVTSHNYLNDPGRAAKIAHYAQAAGGGLAEPVPQVNLSSDGDFVAGHPKHAAPAGPNGTAVENPDIGYKDHVGVLTCKESFAAMYAFFNDGAAPLHPDVVPEDHIEVSGFYKDFSDNTPHVGIAIDIYEVNDATGKRLHDKPDFSFSTGSDGGWGPFVAKPGAHYEFFAPEAGEPPTTGAPGRPQHTYRAPFVHSTHLMYLKALPTLGSFAANIIVGKITYTDDKSGFIIQHGNRAMISKADPGGNGHDSLTVQGDEALTVDVAPESLQLVGLFGFDNGQAPLSHITTLSSPFFLSAVEVNLPTSDPSPVELVFDHTTLHIPRWKSDTEGSSLVLIEE